MVDQCTTSAARSTITGCQRNVSHTSLSCRPRGGRLCAGRVEWLGESRLLPNDPGSTVKLVENHRSTLCLLMLCTPILALSACSGDQPTDDVETDTEDTEDTENTEQKGSFSVPSVSSVAMFVLWRRRLGLSDTTRTSSGQVLTARHSGVESLVPRSKGVMA